MPIETVGRAGPAAPIGRGAARSAATGFSVPARQPGTLAAAAPALEVGLSGMLALQEEQGGAVQDREARRRGQELLAELAALHLVLLGGTDETGTTAVLHRLAGLARAVPLAASPALRQAIAAIVLRSRVELARYDHDNSENTSQQTR
jgi:hypothetical protein